MTSNSFLSHQEIFNSAASHLYQRGFHRGYLGGCPVGRFVNPRDHQAGIAGVPVALIAESIAAVPAYMSQGVVALKRALLRSRINVYDPLTVALLASLQNLHDLVAKWEWPERLAKIAQDFGLSYESVDGPLEYTAQFI
jgi:hypothetical protein